MSLAFLEATMEAVLVAFGAGDVDGLIGRGRNSIGKRLSWPKGTAAFLVFSFLFQSIEIAICYLLEDFWSVRRLLLHSKQSPDVYI